MTMMFSPLMSPGAAPRFHGTFSNLSRFHLRGARVPQLESLPSETLPVLKSMLKGRFPSVRVTLRGHSEIQVTGANRRDVGQANAYLHEYFTRHGIEYDYEP